MKVAFVSYGLLLLHITCLAQGKRFTNTLYFEVGGNGGNYSLNYEKDFGNRFLARVGAGNLERDLSVPALVGRYFGKEAIHFTLMFGFTYGEFKEYIIHKSVSRQVKEFNPTGFLGLRYQVPDDRFFFHFGYTPIFSNSILHQLGAAGGYRFNWSKKRGE